MYYRIMLRESDSSIRLGKPKSVEPIMSKPVRLPIYMDHNATTPIDPHVQAAMEPYLKEQFGNASSASHAYGWQAQAAIRKAREQVATLVGCAPTSVIFTSGATESNNLAILGLARAFIKERPHIITQATEHKAVLEVCEAATEWGAELTVLPVDEFGTVGVKALQAALRPETILVSIMTANNEIGTASSRWPKSPSFAANGGWSFTPMPRKASASAESTLSRRRST